MRPQHCIAILAALSLAHMPALANGGGSSAPPSTTAPQIDPVAKYQEGLRFLEAGKPKKAEAALKKVVRVARKDANAHYALGLAHAQQEEWSAAARSFGKAAKYNPRQVDAFLQQGLAEARRGKDKRAQKVLDKLREQSAECGDACARKSNLENAIQALEAALSGDIASLNTAFDLVFVSAAEGDLAYVEAIRLINSERYERAQDVLMTAGAAFGPHPDILTYFGFANRKSGNYTQALSYYRAALRIDPNHVGANEYLGEYYVEIGNLPAARRQLKKVEANCQFGCVEAEELRAWIASASL